ncbi:hypothetical protein ACET3Z_026398 [Daucus carota]
MADNVEGREVPAHGNEWEVVSLTASAYAASPGPVQVKLNDDNQGRRLGEDKEDKPEADQHENSPFGPEKNVVSCELAKQVDEYSSDFVAEEGGMSNTKDGDNWDVKALSMSDDFPVMQFVNEKGKSLSVGGTEFKEGLALHGLTLVDEEQGMYNTAKYSSFHGEATIGGSAALEEKRTFYEPVDPSEEGLESNLSRSPTSSDENEDDGSELPSEAWWKKRVASLYAQAKEANAMWSILIAAAVMGVVIIGHKWQQRKLHCGDQKMSKMLGPFSGLNSVLVGGHQSGSVIRGRTTSQR